ncbi:MAG: M15 family metallopeptidase [Parvibaculaceae bacterium]
MRSIALAILAGAVAATAACAADNRYGAPPADLGRHLARLKDAYPDVIRSIEGTRLVLKSGAELAISDGRTDKSFDELLDHPDIDDMFALPYPAHSRPAAPQVDSDPGRVRVEALFRAIYGDCRTGGVRAKLRRVSWFGGSVLFTTRNGADRALEAVARDLSALPQPMRKYLTPSAGTYNCRVIAGTDRLSMHAYGASIDLNTKYANYWRWSKAGKDGRYAWTNRIPWEIVDVFERHGFVWGGRWYHFDTMHFEYRPELLAR